MESCWYYSEQHSSFKLFFQHSFYLQDVIKIGILLLATVSINGSNYARHGNPFSKWLYHMKSHPLVSNSLDEEKNGYVARDQFLYVL